MLETYNDISSLGNTKGDHACSVWLNGDEVVGDHSKIMPINSELLHALCRRVDQPKAVLLPRLEAELADAGVRCARKSGVRARIVHLAVDLRLMVVNASCGCGN
jgi:hypothetical protein